MSILIETSYGDITVDLWTEKCPKTTLNFIKLCKIKHFNNALFIQIQKNHIARVLPQNPTTIWEKISKNNQDHYFNDQIDHELKFKQVGYLATANKGPNLNNSQFFMTLTKADLSSLNGKHTVFGKVQQGFDVLRKINDSYCDKNSRPQMNIRILHTFILEDPFQDLPEMQFPAESPRVTKDNERLEAIQHFQMLQKHQQNQNKGDINDAIKRQKAKKQAVTLQMLGDLPDANIKPPQNILFVCKLNPITQQRDLQVIFSRFGPIKNVQIVRDWKTGQSLQYSFIQFQNSTSCEQAYLKMNNVLIDDRRIQVDFSQSVSKMMPRNRKANEPQKRLVKQHETTQKPQKIVKVGRKGQEWNKYNLITSKPNYQSQQKYQGRYEQFKKERYLTKDDKQNSKERIQPTNKQTRKSHDKQKRKQSKYGRTDEEQLRKQQKKKNQEKKKKEKKEKRSPSSSLSSSSGYAKRRQVSSSSSQSSGSRQKIKSRSRDKKKNKKLKSQKKDKKDKKQKKDKKRKKSYSSSSD